MGGLGGNCRCTLKGESATLVSSLLFVSWTTKQGIFLWSTHAQCDLQSYHRTKVTRLESLKMRTKSNLYLFLLWANLTQVFCHNTGKPTQKHLNARSSHFNPMLPLLCDLRHWFAWKEIYPGSIPPESNNTKTFQYCWALFRNKTNTKQNKCFGIWAIIVYRQHISLLMEKAISTWLDLIQRPM